MNAPMMETHRKRTDICLGIVILAAAASTIWPSSTKAMIGMGSIASIIAIISFFRITQERRAGAKHTRSAHDPLATSSIQTYQDFIRLFEGCPPSGREIELADAALVKIVMSKRTARQRQAPSVSRSKYRRDQLSCAHVQPESISDVMDWMSMLNGNVSAADQGRMHRKQKPHQSAPSPLEHFLVA